MMLQSFSLKDEASIRASRSGLGNTHMATTTSPFFNPAPYAAVAILVEFVIHRHNFGRRARHRAADGAPFPGTAAATSSWNEDYQVWHISPSVENPAAVSTGQFSEANTYKPGRTQEFRPTLSRFQTFALVPGGVSF